MNKQNVQKNITLNILFQLINIVYGLILPRILINNYGSEMNGLVSAILQMIGYMTIVEAGLSAASIRQFYEPLIKKDSQKINDLFQSINYYYKKIANYFLLIVVVVAIFYSTVVKAQVENFYVFLLVIAISLSTFFDFSFATKYYIYYLAKKEAYKYQISQIISQFIKIIIALVCVYIKAEVLLLFILVSLVVLIKVIILKRMFSQEEFELCSEYNLIKIDQRNSVFVHQILGLIIYNGPIILISIFIDAFNASVFSIYNLIFGTFYGFYSLIYSQTILPQLGHAISGDGKSNVKKTHERFNKYSIFIYLVVSITTIVMLKSFLEIYITDADIIYYNYTTTMLFLGYSTMNCFKVPYQTLVNANGDFKITIKYSLVEVMIFSLILIINFRHLSINSFVFALFISSLYKMLSLKWFVNVNIFRESGIQHYYQFMSILILLIVGIYNNRNQIISTGIVNWVLSSIGIVLASSLVVAGVVGIPRIILCHISSRNKKTL